MRSRREEAEADRRKDAAVDWFLRRGAGPLTAPQAEAFEAWIAASADNERAYGALDLAWAAAGEVRHDPQVAARGEALIKAVDRDRRTRRAVVAGLAAVVIGAGAGWYGLTAPRPLADQSFQTVVGERATVSLPDGSSITLNTDTRVRTRSDHHRRLVYLDRGQAFFRVAHDRRHPFVVTAAGKTVTALGTAFDVRLEQGGVKVVLVEGKVRVESAASRPATPRTQARGAATAEAVTAAPPPAATEMTAGSELTAPADAEWRLSRTDVDRETSWLRGRLTFDDAPLSEIVAELNRYSTRKIVIADEQLASVRLGGIYTPGDVDGFSRALRAYGVAQVSEGPGGDLRVVPLARENSSVR